VSLTCCEQEFGHSVPEFAIHRDTVDGWKQMNQHRNTPVSTT
jgi:hypothetical protein